MIEMRDSVAFVTGANRGLGRCVARKLAAAGARVLLGVRDPARAAEVIDELKQIGPHPAQIVQIDLADLASIERAISDIRQRHKALHMLVNNAALYSEAHDRTPDSFDPHVASQIMMVNATAPLVLTVGLLPLLRAADWGHVVNITSEMADMDDMRGGYTAYRMSKVALNAMTLNLAAHLRGSKVRISGVDPGWMHTEMGGPEAPLDPEEVAGWVMDAICLPPTAPSGMIWYGPGPQPAPWWKHEA